MEAALIVVGCAIVGGTAALTASRYRELPDRVPIHFGITGVADSYGPRPVAWLVVGVQLFIVVVFAVVHGTGAPSFALLIGDCVLAMLAWIQAQIISLALSGKDRIAIVPIWGMVAVLIALGFLAPHFPR